MAETGRYLYAISRGLDPGALSGSTGLRGAPLELVGHRDLVGVVSDVPLAEFGEEPLRQNLERLDWLEQVARDHDAVVQAAAMAGPTAPMRLAVICHDDAAVVHRLDQWHDDLVAVLDRVEGRAEWSVKVVVPDPEEVDGGPSAQPAPDGGGAAYLRRRKAETEARRDHQERLRRLGDEVHAQLATGVVASRVLPPQDPQLTGHRGTMVLNGAYLVDVDEGDRFAELVDRVSRSTPGASVEAGGPWPPYSFAVLEHA